jgi:hypothetical protein
MRTIWKRGRHCGASYPVKDSPRVLEQVELIGKGAELRFQFDGPGAVGEAMDLMARFQAAKLRVRRGRVSQVGPTADLRHAARRRAEVIQQTREELGAMQRRPSDELEVDD